MKVKNRLSGFWGKKSKIVKVYSLIIGFSCYYFKELVVSKVKKIRGS